MLAEPGSNRRVNGDGIWKLWQWLNESDDEADRLLLTDILAGVREGPGEADFLEVTWEEQGLIARQVTCRGAPGQQDLRD